jgi:hypothetical protein
MMNDLIVLFLTSHSRKICRMKRQVFSLNYCFKACFNSTNWVKHCVKFFLFFVISAPVMAQNADFASKREVEYVVRGKDTLFLPSYYLPYASGGKFCQGLSAELEKTLTDLDFVPIPVLVGNGVSMEQSQEMFIRALNFHSYGYDKLSGYSSAIASVPLPRKFYSEKRLEAPQLSKVFKEQLLAGNVLEVDAATFFPLFTARCKKSEFSDEVKAFRGKVLTHWAAAYPWLFYNLPNESLKDALKTSNIAALDLFIQHRFMNENVSSTVKASQIINLPGK